MASPRKNGMNGDGPDSTVTSTPQTSNARAARTHAKAVTYCPQPGRPVEAAGPARPKISRRGLPE